MREVVKLGITTHSLESNFFSNKERKMGGLWENGRRCCHGNIPPPPPIPADLNLLTENLDFQEVIRSRSTHLPRNCLLSETGRNTNSVREQKRLYDWRQTFSISHKHTHKKMLFEMEFAILWQILYAIESISM